jgi:peptidoglycan hydrolase-like protein with peptidoglycan-binding domain
MAKWKGIIGKPMTVAQFNAYVDTLDFRGKWKAQFCVLHNTAIPTFSAWHSVSGPARMNGLERYYRDVKDWSGGPHLFIADDYIWLFTPLWLPGVHAPSWNGVAWGVEMVGEYTSEKLGFGVFNNTIGALAALHRIGGFSPDTIRLHKEDPKTTHDGCPGKNVEKATIIRGVEMALSGRAPAPLAPTSPTAVGRPVLKVGAKGVEVVELQALLGIKNLATPGTFGPLTESRVKAWQQQHGLEADGIVGARTWESLRGA